MKGWVYILKNPVTNTCYTGSTVDLLRRIRQHKQGNTQTTRILKTDTLVYTEEFDSIDKARIREKQIKSMKSRKYIDSLILSHILK